MRNIDYIHNSIQNHLCLVGVQREHYYVFDFDHLSHQMNFIGRTHFMSRPLRLTFQYVNVERGAFEDFTFEWGI